MPTIDLGSTIDSLLTNREQRRVLEARVAELKKEAKAIEDSLILSLEETGLDSAKSKFGSVTIHAETVANVTDWDEFCAYVRDNDAFYLLTRKVKAPQYRELLNAQCPPPGLEPYVKKSLNLRTL